ncbi:MAG: hypothetical protein ACLP36_02885 [Acidimicrobiales bacterium]
MTPEYSVYDSPSRSSSRAPRARLRAVKRPVLGRSTRAGALCALVGLASSMLVAPTEASAAPFGAGPFAPGSVVVSRADLAPGTILVANGGADGLGSTGIGPGSITIYRPGASGDARPEAVITKGIDGPLGLAFDSSGNLWVANFASSVVEYSKAELAKPSPAPTRTINYRAGGVAFDPSGNLWAVDWGMGTGVEFSKASLAKAVQPRPLFVLGLGDECSVAFDPSGDLWEGGQASNLYEYSEAAVRSSLNPVPKVQINSSDLDTPCQPAFDPEGDLWAGNYSSDTVVEFTKEQLAKSGFPAAKVVISSSYSSPGDVAVSSSGDLWVPYAQPLVPGGPWAVVEFTKAQLTRSGSPKPTVTIAGPHTGLNGPWGVAIEP